MEEWRDVPGYEGLYQISIATKEGRCRSLNYEKTGKVKELSNNPSSREGRINWCLSRNGNRKSTQAAYAKLLQQTLIKEVKQAF